MTEPGHLADSEVLAPELHAGPVGTILDVAEERVGAACVKGWQDEWGVDVRKLVTERAWLSLSFVERLFDRIVREAGPDVLDRIGRLSMSPKHLGPIYPFFRALGTPSGPTSGWTGPWRASTRPTPSGWSRPAPPASGSSSASSPTSPVRPLSISAGWSAPRSRRCRRSSICRPPRSVMTAA
jgi:hypothetical protein